MMSSNKHPDDPWPSWEVFVQSKPGSPHEHVGNVHAPDPEMALQNARDSYTRRGGVRSIWVVPTESITATTSSDEEPFFDPGEDKIYRHQQFYKTPKDVKNI